MGMIGLWGDYVYYPGAAALKAAGFTGVIRYVGIGTGPKRLTAQEYQELTAAGLQVLGVVEYTTTWDDQGYAQGVSDAQATLSDVASLTGGRMLPFYFATNDKTTYVQADIDYVSGFSSVIGPAATGAYGFSSYIQAVQATGKASVFWQCGYPPNMTGTEGTVHFWQRQGSAGNGADGPATPSTVTVNGDSVDCDNQLLPLPAPALGSQQKFLLTNG